MPKMLVCWWQSWPLDGINYHELSGVDCLKNRSDNKPNSEINVLLISSVNGSKIYFLAILGYLGNDLMRS